MHYSHPILVGKFIGLTSEIKNIIMVLKRTVSQYTKYGRM